MHLALRLLLAVCAVFPMISYANKGVALMQDLQRAVTMNVTSLGACKIEVSNHNTHHSGRALYLECVGDPTYDAQIIQSVADVDNRDVPRYATRVWAPGWRDALASRMNEMRTQVVPLNGQVPPGFANGPVGAPTGFPVAPSSETAGGALETPRTQPASYPLPTPRRPTIPRGGLRPIATMQHPLAAAIQEIDQGRVAIRPAHYRQLNCEYRSGRDRATVQQLAAELSEFPARVQPVANDQSRIAVDRRRVQLLLAFAEESRSSWSHESFTIEDACASH